MNTGKATKHAARDGYKFVPFDLDASRARWMKQSGFAEAYDALADEYAALGELLRARKQAGMTQADVAESVGIAQASKQPAARQKARA